MGFEPGTAGWGHRRIHWAMVSPRRRTFNGHKKGHCEVSKEVTHSLCDQIGQFLEFLGNRFNYKSKPNVLWLFEQLWKPLNQTGDATIGQLLEKIGLLFIPTSGHTGENENIFGLFLSHARTYMWQERRNHLAT